MRSVFGLTICCTRRFCMSMNWSILPLIAELKFSLGLLVEDFGVSVISPDVEQLSSSSTEYGVVDVAVGGGNFDLSCNSKSSL
ncbi:hypothetical protein DPMN_163515 [Dreissena polymorpha]|uniref:Uncharacterized protein n=1 Tax=Dreissena polymorpha TaxID=45954 RepID=A0A9D4ES89_DREPO|nr:hypothetical protein DPMN_163515 [Dreissena polymorpha]